jgi:hypothetical protein
MNTHGYAADQTAVIDRLNSNSQSLAQKYSNKRGIQSHTTLIRRVPQ